LYLNICNSYIELRIFIKPDYHSNIKIYFKNLYKRLIWMNLLEEVIKHEDKLKGCEIQQQKHLKG
jgi:hypothetical protein